ncbi:hypothetical protein Q9290_14275 [Oceanimonas sp. CHS3-5]|uniref:hypothetical protein n=1 Tax=Oceanimonas sp. CHS3-5 TaxID=3068186 RepID=UPI00273E76F0|nr:hypothetical protein [Oceanimonas sp. CHS3-5]MDP5293447.1 hypothetical protein [Oceanimonas sp. CHS3-5]
MKTRRFTRCLPLLAAMAIGSAWAVDNEGLFELDYNGPTVANAVDDNNGGGSSDGDDWENIADGSDSAIATTMGDLGGIINDTKGSNDDVFTGGGSKDDLDIPNWMHKSAKSTPDKDNITNAYAAAYQNALGEVIVYFGADRFANNGDAQMGFWFFHDNVSLNPDGTFNGVHTIGDTLILANFSNGGTVNTIEVWEWRPGAGSDGNINLFKLGDFGACDGTNPNVCALNNDSDTPSFWPYDPKFGTTGQIPDNSLFEGGINLNQVIGDDICFSSFMAETRSSTSVDAQLKDFALGDFSLCGIDITKECRDLDPENENSQGIINEDGSLITLGYEGTVVNTGAITYQVFLEDLVDGNGGTTGGDGITQVCIDGLNGNPEDGMCQADEDLGAGVLNGDGTATFDLPGGQTALYIGEWTVSGEPTSLTFGNEIQATATINGIPVFSEPASDTTTCVVVGNADIEVLKMCSNPTIVGGDTFEADITGVATNTGNVKLNEVSLVDVTDLGAPAGAYTFVRDANKNGLVDVGEPAFNNGVDSLTPGEMVAFKAKVSSTSFTTHENTITASGTNAFDSSDQPSDSASVTAEDQCSVSPDPVIAIEKLCDDDFGSNGSGVELTATGSPEVIAVKVYNTLTATNNGTEDLTNVVISDAEGGLTWVDNGGSSFDCSAGTSCTGTLQVGESADFTMNYLPDAASSIIGALTNPGGILFENTAFANGDGVLSGLSAPEVSDDAECALCN